MSSASILRTQIESILESRIPGALSFRPKTIPQTIPIGIPELDQQTGGIPRGCLTEVCGPTSSGRTTVLLSVMREMTQQGECCALIDCSNAFDPLSAQGVDLRRLLWVRCSGRHTKLTPMDKALRATDLVINAGGFGLVVLDLGDVPEQIARRVPLTSWYRFRRAVEGTSAVFLVIAQCAAAKSCSSLVLQLQALLSKWPATPGASSNPELFTGAQVAAEILRSRTQVPEIYGRKPAASVTSFDVSTAWAG